MRHSRENSPTTTQMPAPDDAEALDRIGAIAAAETIEQAWAQVVAALVDFGFERVNYGYTRYRVGESIGDPLDAMFLSSHALEQVKWFHDSGTYLKSADYRWVRDNVGACSWGWAHEERAAGRLSAGECEVMDMLGRSRAGYTVSFPVGAPRSKGAMGLAAARGVPQAEVDRHWQDHRAALMAVTHMAHLKLSQMPLPVSRGEMSARQVEILEWIADGKTLADVSVLTGLSLSTVEKHVRKARDHLQVETTAQAVAKLGFLNQLFVTGPSDDTTPT